MSLRNPERMETGSRTHPIPSHPAFRPHFILRNQPRPPLPPSQSRPSPPCLSYLSSRPPRNKPHNITKQLCTNPPPTPPQNRGGVTIGDGAVIGACSLVKHDVPPMSVAFGVPARVVRYLKDVKPALNASSVMAHTMADGMRLGNRLPMRGQFDPVVGVGVSRDGCRGSVGGGGGAAAVAVGGDDDDDDGLLDDFDRLGVDTDVDMDGPLASGGRRFSDASGSTAHSVLRDVGLRDRLGRGSARDREVRALLLPRRRHQQRRRRRWDVEAAAITAVVIALLMVFFFVGVYLGASKISFGSDFGYL